MALQAGRVGVRDDQVDSYGRLKTEEYSLPTATASRLGGVKVGTGLSVTSGGVLSASVDLSNCLQKPSNPPEVITLVAIGTDGSQTPITLGTGFSVVDGVLTYTAPTTE